VLVLGNVAKEGYTPQMLVRPHTNNANNLLALSSSEKGLHLVRAVDVGCVAMIPGDCHRAVYELVQRVGTRNLLAFSLKQQA
jgi:hypothetical protein